MYVKDTSTGFKPKNSSNYSSTGLRDIAFLGYHCISVPGNFFLPRIIKYLRIYSRHGDLITINPKVAYIPGRDTSVFGKDYTNGSVTYVYLSVVSRKKYLQSLVVRIPVSNPSEKAVSVVENAKKWEIGCLFHTQFPYFRRCIKPGLMISSKSITVSGFGGTEGSVFSP